MEIIDVREDCQESARGVERDDLWGYEFIYLGQGDVTATENVTVVKDPEATFLCFYPVARSSAGACDEFVEAIMAERKTGASGVPRIRR